MMAVFRCPNLIGRLATSVQFPNQDFHMKLIAFLPLALLVASVPANAQTRPQQTESAQSQQAQPSNGQAAPDPNRKICKTEELIGSRLGTSRVCKTAAQWEAERHKAQGTDQQ